MTSSKGVGLAAPKVVPRFKGPVLVVGSKGQKLGWALVTPCRHRWGCNPKALGLRCIQHPFEVTTSEYEKMQ